MRNEDGDLAAEGGVPSVGLDGGWARALSNRAPPVAAPAAPRPALPSNLAGLRIAQVPPLIESVPPKGYGGTERVVSVLTEELVKLGCDVTLYASGDSRTSARLKPVVKRSLRLDPGCEDDLPYHLLQIEQVVRDASHYDLIHFHNGMLHYSVARRLLPPSVTTLHGRLDLTDGVALLREFVDAPSISISLAQRRPLPWLNWVGNVYHGYPPGDFAFSPSHDGYLAFLGRFCPEKRPDRAIKIAAEAGLKLRVAAKIDPVDRGYFEDVVRPLLKQRHVEYLGEIGDREKQELLGGAVGALLPIDWPEPFGLTMIEAMACGTPTIAYGHGSVPEIIEPGLTGFIVSNRREAVAAVEKLYSLDRAAIRRRFTERFSAENMVNDYLGVYRGLLQAPIRAAS
ncbi:MAG TPA: glycosyltransferase family 4 protein [Gammaproteobacteria bacterium]|nr:glycosyltransferase family 4 protein [Gammaproteobacteria bacterium]